MIDRVKKIYRFLELHKNKIYCIIYGIIATILISMIFKNDIQTAILSSSIFIFIICLIRLKIDLRYGSKIFCWENILCGMIGWFTTTIVLIICSVINM